MKKVINIEQLISDLRFYESHCDLIKDNSKKNPLAHCGGYPNECNICELPKYNIKVKNELKKTINS